MDELKVLQECEEAINKNGFMDASFPKLSENERRIIIYKLTSNGKYIIDLTPHDKQWILRKNPTHKPQSWSEQHPIKDRIRTAAISAGFSLLVGLLLWIIANQRQHLTDKQQNLRLDSLEQKVYLQSNPLIKATDSAKHK